MMPGLKEPTPGNRVLRSPNRFGRSPSGGGGEDSPLLVMAEIRVYAPFSESLAGKGETMDDHTMVERRALLKGAVMLAGAVGAAKTITEAAAQTPAPTQLTDVPLSAGKRATVERRGQIVLIGINRPDVFNRFDPETTHALALAFTGYEHDDTL